jgi:hypothetical protein
MVGRGRRRRGTSKKPGAEIVQSPAPRLPLVRRPLRFDEEAADAGALQRLVERAGSVVDPLFGDARAQPQQVDARVEGRRVAERPVVRRLQVEVADGRAESADATEAVQVGQGNTERLRASKGRRRNPSTSCHTISSIPVVIDAP